MSDLRPDIFILLTGEYMAVANCGRPFSREGVEAICSAHLSPKRQTADSPINTVEEAEALLNVIREGTLGAYKSRPSFVIEHASGEEVLRSEYAGRILPELLQNAHDAIANRPIGSKGVGFKGVLNVSNGPRIHSGHLHLGFDRERTISELRERGLNANGRVPLLRLPFPVSTQDEPKPVQDLVDSFDTVVVLPLIDQGAYRRLVEQWTELIESPSVLLFLPALGCVAWERHDQSGDFVLTWCSRRSGELVEIHCDGTSDAVERWKVWASTQASIALRIDDNNSPIPDRHYPHLRVFFETDERSPLPFLVHGAFPLKEGRDNVLTHDESARPQLQQVVGDVARLSCTVLSQLTDAGLLLDLIRPRVEPDQMGDLERELWNAIAAQIGSIEVPGKRTLKIEQVRLRPKRSNGGWWWFSCDLWNAFKVILADHRAGGLDGLPLLPPGIDNEEREGTILHLNPDARLSPEELRDLPLLPVEGSANPVVSAGSNIFFPPKEPPPAAPAGVGVCFLGRAFTEAIDESEQSGNLRELLTKVLEVSSFKPLDLVEKAILPILRVRQQPEDLLAFLCSVIAPAIGDDDLIFDWRNTIRKELAERLMLQTRDGTSMPAAQVYAGADWTGSEFLERAYASARDRGFLHSPPTEQKEREQWERFYRWVGVGWSPKVLPIVCYETKQGTREGPKWTNGQFALANPPEGWRDYCGQFHGFENQRRNARLRQNWMLDGGSAVLTQDGAFASIIGNWKYYSGYREAAFYRSSQQSKDFDNNRCNEMSYLHWLFRSSEWIPAKRSSQRQPPEDVFTRSEFSRALGAWAYEIDGDADEKVLEPIGVRSGWTQLADVDWTRWLKRAGEVEEEQLNQSRELKDSVYRLYESALKHWSARHGAAPQPQGAWKGPIWCMERRPDNTEIWQRSESADDVYFVDRADLERLRLPGLWIFPVRLNGLEERARERFGLKLLSEHLCGEPIHRAFDESAAQSVHQRMEERLPALNAFIQITMRENSDELNSSNLPSIRVVRDLIVQFRVRDGETFGKERLDAYFQAGEEAVQWLDTVLFHEDGNAKTGVWESVASAITYAANLATVKQPAIKDILMYEGQDLERKLLDLGVTKETIDSITRKGESNLPAIRKDIPPAVPQPLADNHEAHAGDSGAQAGDSQRGGSYKTGDRIPTQRAAAGGGLTQTGGRSGGGGERVGRGSAGLQGAEAGRLAEEWMREELRKRLETDGWAVSAAPTRDEESRETDIELHHEDFGTFHVEVKYSEADRLYWSEKEVGKAQQHPGCYFMSILVPGDNEGFGEYWLVDPLEALHHLPRSGVWVWSGREEGVALQEQPDAWAIPKPKPTRAAKFSFSIQFEREWLGINGKGFDQIRQRLHSRHE